MRWRPIRDRPLFERLRLFARLTRSLRRTPLPVLTVGAGLAAGAAMSACAANAQVKIASTEFNAALVELRSASRDFRKVYTAEIQRTRDDLQRAIVARAVRLRVERISEELDERESELAARGLISLADELARTEEAYRGLAELVASVNLRRDQRAEGGVARVLDAQAAAARTTAEALRAVDPAAAEELESRARALEERKNLDFLEDPKIGAYIDAMLELGTAADEAGGNLRQLDALIRVLQETHSVIHEWIMTDVSVSGEQLADLFEEHAETLGLPPGAGDSATQGSGDGGVGEGGEGGEGGPR